MQVLPVSTRTIGSERVLVAAAGAASSPIRPSSATEVGLDVLASASRLVVLVPSAGVDPNALADEVRQLDSGQRLLILFLALAPAREIDEAWVRRELITLGSLTQEARRRVELRIEPARDWMEAVRQVRHEGDVLLCLEGDGVPAWRRPRRGLAETLALTFGGPVVELRGLRPGGLPSGGGLARILRGAVSFLIIAAFLGVQIGIERNLALMGWPRPALQSILLGVELWLIWRWESSAGWTGG
jgi:hypothetical protein